MRIALALLLAVAAVALPTALDAADKIYAQQIRTFRSVNLTIP